MTAALKLRPLADDLVGYYHWVPDRYGLVAQAINAVEAIDEFRRHRPDVTLMDLRLPGTNGTDALIAIRGEFPRARIIMLTTSDSDGEIKRALQAGASAYMLKSMPKNELLAVIRAVHSGHRKVPPEVAARIAEHLGEEDFTTREFILLTSERGLAIASLRIEGLALHMSTAK